MSLFKEQFMSAEEALYLASRTPEQIIQDKADELIAKIQLEIERAVRYLSYSVKVVTPTQTDYEVSDIVMEYFKNLGYHIEFVNGWHTYMDGSREREYYAYVSWKDAI